MVSTTYKELYSGHIKKFKTQTAIKHDFFWVIINRADNCKKIGT
jgi:hypothetical protein